MDQAPVREGDVLAQKYRVDRVLGVGGMGVVVAATHLQLDQRVALKFMLPEAFQNPEALARFQREARAAVKLKSEHVARVLDTGTFENNSPYIVMEYLEGTDLAGELEKRGALPPATVAEYIIHGCDALAEAHALGIVHRDLKPANLFLTKRADGSPLVKVLDFGISKANSLTESGLGMTKTASMMGSPLYMSPEQMRSAKDVDARTDVWSLGVIMYELLGGRVPFNSDTLGGLMSMVMMEQPMPLETLRADTPRELAQLVRWCLEKDPSRRAASVADIAIGLRPFAPTRAHPIVERITNLLGGGSMPSMRSVSSVASTHLPQAMASSVQTAPGWGSISAAEPVVPKKGAPVGLIVGGCVGAVAILGIAVFGVVHFGHAKAAATAEHTPEPTAAPIAQPTIATTATTAATTSQVTPITTASTPVTAPINTAIAVSHVRTKPTTSATAATPTATAVTVAPTATTQKPGILDTSN